jgi:arsenate reductase
MEKTKVIFLCSHNSARSQMAEAFLRKYADDHFKVYSAGFELEPIHPYVMEVMKELGYDLSGHYPKDLRQYLGKERFGIIITVCEHAERDCPTFPGVSTRLYWPFEDPVVYQGNDEQKLAKFREVRNKIDEQIKTWLKEKKIAIRIDDNHYSS